MQYALKLKPREKGLLLKDFLYTVEPLYRGHLWDPAGSPSEVARLYKLYMAIAGTVDSVLIRVEYVTRRQSVLGC